MSHVIVEKRDAERLVAKMAVNTLQVYLLETMHPFLVSCTPFTTIVLTLRYIICNSFLETILAADHGLNSEILHVCVHGLEH